MSERLRRYQEGLGIIAIATLGIALIAHPSHIVCPHRVTWIENNAVVCSHSENDRFSISTRNGINRNFFGTYIGANGNDAIYSTDYGDFRNYMDYNIESDHLDLLNTVYLDK